MKRRGLSSLRSRLILLGVGLVLLSVGVTAFVVQQVTRSDIRDAIQRDLDVDVEIRDSIVFHGVGRGNWDDVDEVVDKLADFWEERIAIADLDGRILADSARRDGGEQVPSLPNQATLVDPLSQLVEFEPPTDPVERREFEAFTAEACYELVGIAVKFEIDDDGLPSAVPIRQPPPDDQAVVAECLNNALKLARADGLGSDQLPPLQLFIGIGDQQSGGVLTSGGSWRFWAAVAAIVAGAVVLAVVVAGRIANPLRRLTAAAQQMSDGELTTRVGQIGHGEVAELGAAFDDMAASLDAQDAARRTLTADISHELRSPLANLRGYLEAIQDGVVPADAATIASLHDEVLQLQVLSADLQELSLAQAGGLRLERVPVDMAELANSVGASHRATATRAGVAVRVDGAAGSGEVIGDPVRLRRAMSNLVSNAIRHAPPDSTVEVTVVVDADRVDVMVADQGEGIAAEHLPHVFDRFYRVDASRSRQTGGSGLGLAITRELVEAHGGSVEAASTVGQGSTFTIRLPRAPRQNP